MPGSRKNWRDKLPWHKVGQQEQETTDVRRTHAGQQAWDTVLPPPNHSLVEGWAFNHWWDDKRSPSTQVPQSRKRSARLLPSALPEDILLSIFETVMHTVLTYKTIEAYSLDFNLNLSRLIVPLIIASVCKAWRALAINTPSLWTYIVIPKLKYTSSLSTPPPMLEEALDVFTTRWLTMLQLLLQRSRDATIELHLCRLEESDLVSESRSLRIYGDALDLLRPHFPRIKLLRVSMVGPKAGLWQRLGARKVEVDLSTGALLEVNFPSLEKLFVAHSCEVRQDDIGRLSIEAPCLRHIHLQKTRNIVFSRTASSVNLIIEEDSSFSPSSSSSISSCMHAVTHLRYVKTSHFPMSDTMSQVFLPRLRFLSVSSGHIYDPYLLRHLTRGALTLHTLVISSPHESLGHIPAGVVRLDLSIWPHSNTFGSVQAREIFTQCDERLRQLVIRNQSYVTLAFLSTLWALAPSVEVELIRVSIAVPLHPEGTAQSRPRRVTTQPNLAPNDLLEILKGKEVWEDITRIHAAFVYRRVEDCVLVFNGGSDKRLVA
ncbi:hypothetical protein BKA62DRAFT_715553 [Auriculariales sp. MPI-PUGE-AT-0066]|nr:hypothetical protein BKA62DRAFT_715553 [Auriculariales sp. MPI-PUGE-AT-0066]